ncbi:MAG: hypothetical protein Q9183_006784 [Haloplaca sp. 2 TL-2023]
MSSGLRNSFLPSSSTQTPAIVRKSSSLPQPPQKKQKMSITQTYYLAHTARAKLQKEANKPDHNLRLLVGHANLLDGLMLDLADAEREQESWFNQTVKGAAKASNEPRHIQWADTIEEAIEDDEYDSDSDSEDEMEQAQQMPITRLPQEKAPPASTLAVVDDSDEEMEDDEDNEDHALIRVSSRSSSEQPPELLHESDSESDDDMPPSPPTKEIPLDAFSEKQRQSIATTGFYPTPEHEASLSPESQASFFDDGFFIPQRQQTAF